MRTNLKKWRYKDGDFWIRYHLGDICIISMYSWYALLCIQKMLTKSTQLKTNRIKKKRCKRCKEYTRTTEPLCESCTKMPFQNAKKIPTKMQTENAQKFHTKIRTKNATKIPNRNDTKVHIENGQDFLEYSKQNSTKKAPRIKQKPSKITSKQSKAKLARYYCHKYIRERDKDKPCISCNKYTDTIQAGHYKPDGQNSLLRYNEYNIHGQCVECNMMKSGNVRAYKASLEHIYPQAILSDLEAPKEPYSYSDDILDLVISHYKYLYDSLGG